MNPQDKVILQKAIDERTFDALKRVANLLINNWSNRSCIKETEFETVKAIITKESKIEALKSFLEQLEQQIYDR